MADARFLLDLRNDPEVRRQSRIAAPVSEKEHLSWLDGTLADVETHLFVIDADGIAVGQLRLDGTGTEAELSLALTESARGKGIGTAALLAAHNVAHGLELTSVRAVVKESNSASLATFTAAGYGERRRRYGLVELEYVVTAK
jgi:RimJ/RimL family protein N-acetyltransferase